MKFTIAHEFDCDAKTYWEIFFDLDYQKDMYSGLGIKERTVLLFEEDDKEIRRRIKIVPQRDLPGALKAVLKGDLGYIEHNVYHKGKDVMDVRIEPTLMAEWQSSKPLLEWKEAKPAARDAWNRLSEANRG